jgi:membrane fusion protein, multidrug efflux system
MTRFIPGAARRLPSVIDSLHTSHSSMRSSRISHTAIALLLVAGACGTKKDARSKPPVPVVVAHVRKMDVPYTVEANGVVVPLQSSAVGSQVEGVVQRVAFVEGADVRQGQVLFEIDPRPYRAAYNQAAANLLRDKANAENAQRESERYASLVAQDYVTKEQADQQRANAAAANATVAATEAAVATAKFNLDNTVIRAPIGGRTGAVLVKAGNLVHANGATPLVVINQVKPILVRFAIPSTQLPLLQRYGTNTALEVLATPNAGTGQMADSTPVLGLNIGGGDPGQSTQQGGPPGSGGNVAGGGGGGNGGGRGGRNGGGRGGQPGGAGASSPGGQGAPRGAPSSASSQLISLVQQEHGTLSFIDNAVDTTTGTVLLKATFPNPDNRLWSGEFVSTELRLFVEQNALVVPSSAVVIGQQGAYVYVISDSSTSVQRPVVVERTAGSLAVIASGLRGSEQVVTDGQSRLTPNSKVTITTPAGNSGAGGGKGGRGGRGGKKGAGPGAGGSAPKAP